MPYDGPHQKCPMMEWTASKMPHDDCIKNAWPGLRPLQSKGSNVQELSFGDELTIEKTYSSDLSIGN
jgi:hypothetical protein